VTKLAKTLFSIGYFKTEEEWGAYDATEILGGMFYLIISAIMVITHILDDY
jgi:hypothetical protein